MSKLLTLDEHIAQSLRRSEESGELQTTRSWGKPIEADDGFDETPGELRMAFKMLKDAGFVPPEVEMMNRLAALRKQLEALNADSGNDATISRQRLKQQIAELQLSLSMRLERMASGNI